MIRQRCSRCWTKRSAPCSTVCALPAHHGQPEHCDNNLCSCQAVVLVEANVE